MNEQNTVTAFRFIAITCAFFLVGIPQTSLAETGAEPRQVFDWMKRLEGRWTLSGADYQEGGTKTHPSVVHMFGTDQVAMEFKLIGRETTVQEDLLPGTARQMVTMYHCKDATCSAVKATHYCAKGNQPEFLASMSSSSHQLKFDCDMGTELCQSWDGHIHQITHQLSDDGQHLRSVYAAFLDGEHTSDTIFHFERATEQDETP